MKDTKRQFLDGLKQTLSIPEYFGHAPGYTGKILCPNPGHNDTDPSLHIFGEDNAYCFVCNEPVDIIRSIMWSEDLEFWPAVRRCADIAGIPVPETLDQRTIPNQERHARLIAYRWLHDLFGDICTKVLFGKAKIPLVTADDVEWEHLPDFEKARAKAALKTARRHYHFSDHAIQAFRIGYCPSESRIFLAYLDYMATKGELPPLIDEALVGSGLFTHEDLAPVLGGRLLMGYGMTHYFTGRALEGIDPTMVASAKYMKPFGPSDKRPEVWDVAAQPLLVSPECSTAESGTVAPTPWSGASDVILAEGIPDAISAFQAGYPVVSAVSTHAAKGRQREELLRLCSVLQRSNRRLVAIFDEEENESGIRGVIRTLYELADLGYPVLVARLPNPACETGG
jgi:hypothetical protein